VNRVRAALVGNKRDLEAEGSRFALVGGFAVGARALPRTTRDVDLAVAVENDRAAEALVHALRARGYDVVAVVEQKAVGRLATARLRASKLHVIIDLLFASSGVEQEVVERAETLEVLEGTWLRVASIADLVALKVLARDDRRRPQDRIDLEALLREATEQDVAEARATLALIAARGYARGKDLEHSLDEILAERDPTSRRE
jgi:predicted nucleotidyltransferase